MYRILITQLEAINVKNEFYIKKIRLLVNSLQLNKFFILSCYKFLETDKRIKRGELTIEQIYELYDHVIEDKENALKKWYENIYTRPKTNPKGLK